MEMEEPILKESFDDVVQTLAVIFGLSAIMPYYSEIRSWVGSGVQLNTIIEYLHSYLGK